MTMATPLQIVSSSVLSTDYLASNQVLADTTSATPVSVFRNPFKNGAVEALVITSALGMDGQLCYLNQDASALTGWQLTALPTAPGWPAVTASEVVAFATTWNTVEAYFVGLDGSLYHLTMDGGGTTWNAPQAVDSAPSGMSHLGVSYQPGATNTNGKTMVVMAMTADAAVFQTVTSDGDWISAQTNPFLPSDVDSLAIMQRTPLEGAVSYMSLVHVADGSLYVTTLGVGTGQSPTFGPKQVAAVEGGAVLGVAVPGDQTPFSVVFVGTATGITWATESLDDDLNLSFPTGQLTLPTAVRGGAVISLTSGLANIYFVDANDNVWLVPVTGWDNHPCGYTLTYNTPVFGQPIQLNVGIGTIHADMMPTDAPTLIGVDTALGALHLNYKDPSIGNWRTGAMVLPSTEQYTVARWRTEIAVYDAQGQPVPNYQLTVAADSAVDVAVGGQFYYVDSATTTTVTTNALGKATLATLATGLTTAQLTVSATDLPQAVTIAPHQGISDYMAGTGTLPGMPVLSGDTLQQATVGGQPLAPALGSIPDLAPKKVAGYLRQLAQAPANNTTTLHATVASGGARYLVLTKLGPADHAYHEFATAEELEAHHAGVRAALGSSLWSDVWDWAGDVWEGIKHAAISVYHATLDTAENALKLFVKIGEDAFELALWSVKTIEGALHSIEAIFNWIGAEVDKVVDWLKAIFDFTAIWNTKTALENGIAGYLTCMGNGIDAFSNYFAGTTSPIASLKATIDQQFDRAIQQFSGKAFSGLSGWQTPGRPPSQAAGPNGTPAAATYSNSAHANWFHDQVLTNAPTTIDGTSGLNDQTEWNNLVTALGNVTGDLESAFDDFASAFSALFTVHDLSTLGDILIADFLSAIKALVDAVLDAVDALIQAILLLAKTVVVALDDLLTTEISIGFLNTLYGWMAGWAGVSNPPALTPAGLFSLLIAFPATVIFKIAVGVDKEPFPSGQLPTPGSTEATMGAGGVGASPTVAWLAWSSALLGAIATSANFLPAILDDVAGDDLTWASTWKTVGSIVAAVTSMAPTMIPEAYDWTAALSSGGAELVAAVGTALIMAAVMLSGLLAVAWRWIQSDQAKDPIRIVSTIFGVGMLAYQIFVVADEYDQLSDAQIAGDLMSPWGNIMSMAGTSWVKKSELYPLALVFQIAGDLLSTIGSGVAGIEGQLSNEPSLA